MISLNTGSTSTPRPNQREPDGDEPLHVKGRNMRASRQDRAMRIQWAERAHGQSADSAGAIAAADFRVPNGRSAANLSEHLR
jgi:hypothetical protein